LKNFLFLKVYFMNKYFKQVVFFVFFFSPIFSCGQVTTASSPGNSFLIRPWAVGQFATYQTKTYKDQTLVDSEITTYSIVGFEEVKGKNYFWVEVEQAKANGVTVTQKMELLQPETNDFENHILNDFRSWTPRRRIQKISLPGPLKRTSVNEFELPPDSVSLAEKGPFGRKLRFSNGQAGFTPEQPVKTDAGSFKATKVHMTFSPIGLESSAQKNQKELLGFIDVWGSPQIPILGLVKKSFQSSGSNGSAFSDEVELVAWSDRGGVSKIKGYVPFVSLEQQKKMKDALPKNNPGDEGDTK
jgi:hypothetical protein